MSEKVLFRVIDTLGRDVAKLMNKEKVAVDTK
jgi:hypothetical protein